MTKYLGKEPFGSKPATDAYRAGWERTFGKRRRRPRRQGRAGRYEDLKLPQYAGSVAIGALKATLFKGALDKFRSRIPPCAASMGCLCAGHARGNAHGAPCDTSELSDEEKDDLSGTSMLGTMGEDE